MTLNLEEYAALDAIGLRTLIAAGAVTAPEVEDVARRALIEANADLNALTGGLYNPALDANPHGPFAGVPFLIKDSAPFARGSSFTLGSRSVRGARAVDDHPLMARFRAAGMVTLGQTTTPEWSLSFATESRRHGTTRNPWALNRGAGGSSGGAAALVAAGAVPLAHASDGAGSIRVPASCCGLVGLKPGRGSIPSTRAQSPSPRSASPVLGEPLGVDFAVTRSVRDTAALFRVVSGAVPADPDGPRPPAAPLTPGGDPLPLQRRLRIAVTADAWSGVPVDREVAAATDATAQLLEWIGHTVELATPPLTGDSIVDATMLGILSAGRAVLAAPVRPAEDLLEAVSLSILREAAALDGATTQRYLRAQRHISDVNDGFFDRYDVLITPTLAQLPAPHGTLPYDVRPASARVWVEKLLAYGPFTAPFNVSGHPAISLPLGESRNGLPIGVQLVAARGGEELLLSLAGELEQARPWRARNPSVFVG